MGGGDANKESFPMGLATHAQERKGCADVECIAKRIQDPCRRTDRYRPVQFYPVRPATEKRDMFSEETFVPVEAARAMQPVTPEQGTISHSSCRFSFNDPLPERFNTWSFQVSSDAGTPAARERAIEAARAAQNR